MNKMILLSVGLFVVTVGMGLTLHHWRDVTIVFHGVVPPAVAVLGLVIMFAATIKR